MPQREGKSKEHKERWSTKMLHLVQTVGLHTRTHAHTHNYITRVIAQLQYRQGTIAQYWRMPSLSLNIDGNTARPFLECCACIVAQCACRYYSEAITSSRPPNTRLGRGRWRTIVLWCRSSLPLGVARQTASNQDEASVWSVEIWLAGGDMQGGRRRWLSPSSYIGKMEMEAR